MHHAAPQLALLRLFSLAISRRRDLLTKLCDLQRASTLVGFGVKGFGFWVLGFGFRV